jgi:hypothetical protein
MATGKEVCTVCDKPSHGRQKVVRSGGCDTRFHCMCFKISDTELAFYIASSKSSWPTKFNPPINIYFLVIIYFVVEINKSLS